MRSLERRFKIQQDKTPEYSSLVNFGRAVEHQQFSKPVIVKWFYQLVEEGDYEKEDADAIIEHMMRLSHSAKPAEDEANRGVNST